MRAPRTLHHMDTRSRLSTFGVAEILLVSLSHLQMNRGTDTTLSNGLHNNLFAMAKLPCGAGLMRDSTNGQRRKNFRRIWRRSFPSPPRTRDSIIHPTTTSG